MCPGDAVGVETPSVAQMQKDFVEVSGRLSGLVTDLRGKLESFEKGLGDKVEAQVGTLLEARATGLSGEIKELRDQQQQLLLRLNRPAAPDGGGTIDPAKRAFFCDQLRWNAGKAEIRDSLPKERRALVENSTGEIAVPEDLESEWIRAIGKETVFRALVDVKTTKSNRMRKRSRTKVTVAMGKLELGDSLHESTLTPSEEYQYVEDMLGYTELGVDELMDSDANLVAFISEDFVEGFVELEDTQIWSGAGHASREFGGLSRGTTITRVPASSASVISVDDFLSLFYEVAQQYRRNAACVFHSSTELGLMLLREDTGGAGTGGYLWQPSMIAGTPNRLRGYACYTQDDIDEWDGTTGNDVAVFGDMRRLYRILDRQGYTLAILDQIRRTSGLIGYLATRRVGGEIMIAEAGRILQLP